MTATAPWDVKGLQWGLDYTAASYPKLENVKIPVVWAYVTGTDDIKWTAAQVSRRIDMGSKLIRINQGYESTSLFDEDEFDVESLAWTNEQAVAVANDRAARKWSTRFYTSYDNYTALTKAIGDKPYVYYHIAAWPFTDLAQLALHRNIYAVQYASSTANPDYVVPGTSLTLKDVNADVNLDLGIFTGWVD